MFFFNSYFKVFTKKNDIICIFIFFSFYELAKRIFSLKTQNQNEFLLAKSKCWGGGGGEEEIVGGERRRTECGGEKR